MGRRVRVAALVVCGVVVALLALVEAAILGRLL